MKNRIFIVLIACAYNVVIYVQQQQLYHIAGHTYRMAHRVYSHQQLFPIGIFKILFFLFIY